MLNTPISRIQRRVVIETAKDKKVSEAKMDRKALLALKVIKASKGDLDLRGRRESQAQKASKDRKDQ